MKIRSLQADELDALYDLLAISYCKEGADPAALRASFRQVIESDLEFNLDLNRVLEVDGRLVARIGIYDRRMFLNGKLLRVGAIGGVCTSPEFRGRGYVRALLEDCTNYMRAHDFDVSLLFGEPAIYGKSGWQTLSAFGMSTNFKLADAGSLPVRDGDPIRDVAVLARIHQAASSRLNGPFQRTEQYWRSWISRVISQKKIYRLRIVGADGDAPVGYFVLKGDSEICELGWDMAQADAMAAVVQAIFADQIGATVKFRFFLPDLFDYVSAHSVAPTLDEMRWQEYYIKKEALYRGLFKLISNKLDVRSTAELVCRLRSSDYVFWDLDHF
ncbi:MAG: GNAT family N-acetyltransferase [Kiritimatiellia bacterium]